MSQYVVKGGKRLEGELQVEGSKNAALPILAATLLNEGITYLDNCPRISDVEIMRQLLEELGCKTKWDQKTLVIDTSTLIADEISEKLVKRMRSSIILLGALLGRCGRAKMSQPGGCQLGARPIDLHLDALKRMGVEINEEQGSISCKVQNLQGATIHLKFPSVGATENIMLAAVKSKGETIIYNAAREPEIIDLQNFLVSCGADVRGAGTRTIIIRGVPRLRGVSYRVIPDRIIAGTYMVAAAITRGEMILKDINSQHLTAVMDTLSQMGCRITDRGSMLEMSAPAWLDGVQIITAPYPGFPTDMQSQMLALACSCGNISKVTERLFESRFKTVEELWKMGADIRLDGCEATVIPTEKLVGCLVTAKDLRGGAALVLAGLAAEGITIIEGTEHIKRGYSNMVKDLADLGAQIEERE